MTAKDRLNRIKTVIDGGGVYRDYNDSTQAFNTDVDSVEQALTELEELKRDVARYFELQNMWNWKQRKEWTDELDAEYDILRVKLSKVGKEK